MTGAGVGTGVGTGVGFGVGFGVGTGVGFGVGFGVGDAVGVAATETSAAAITSPSGDDLSSSQPSSTSVRSLTRSADPNALHSLSVRFRTAREAPDQSTQLASSGSAWPGVG